MNETFYIHNQYLRCLREKIPRQDLLITGFKHGSLVLEVNALPLEVNVLPLEVNALALEVNALALEVNALPLHHYLLLNMFLK